MRSAQLTTSPSGVAGAGRDHEWLRMPSSVSSHRFRSASETSAPHTAWSNPSGRKIPERVLAHVPARSVAAVVAQRDRLGQRHVQATGPGDARRHLGHLEGVAQSGALVVGGEDEDLRLSRQTAEGGGVQDAVPVALEAGPPRVGLFGDESASARSGPGGPGHEDPVLPVLRVRGAPGAALRPRCPGWPRSRRARCARRRPRGPPWSRPSGGPARSARRGSAPWALV